MTMGEKGVCVRILEKEFRIGCASGHEATLREAAHYLDQQMRRIRQSGKVVGIERIAVMAALNIANELLNVKNTPPKIDGDFTERLQLLRDKIDSVLAQHSKVRTEQQQNLARKIQATQESIAEELI